MDVVKEKQKVSNKTCAFTLPLGATINMDGTALYECIVVYLFPNFMPLWVELT